MRMLPYRDSRLTYAIIAILFVLLAGYAYFEAQGILFGPTISISSNITDVHQPFITIKGKASHIASLTVNGKAVDVTEAGDFSVPYLLADGYNRIVLDARDKYGRSRSKVLQIVYTPAATSSPQSATAATSSPPSATPAAH